MKNYLKAGIVSGTVIFILWCFPAPKNEVHILWRGVVISTKNDYLMIDTNRDEKPDIIAEEPHLHVGDRVSGYIRLNHSRDRPTGIITELD